MTALREVPLHDGPRPRVLPTHLRLSRSGFSVAATRIDAARLRQIAGCYVSRHTPPDHEQQFVEALRRQLGKKQRQLARQKARGRGTLLLLDTDDFALLNEVRAWEGFASAAEGQDTSAIDEVFVFNEMIDRRGPHGFLTWPLRYRDVQYPDPRWMDEFRRAEGVLQWPQDYEERHGPAYLLDVGGA